MADASAVGGGASGWCIKENLKVVKLRNKNFFLFKLKKCAVNLEFLVGQGWLAGARHHKHLVEAVSRLH